MQAVTTAEPAVPSLARGGFNRARIRLSLDRTMLFVTLVALWELAGRYWVDPVWSSRPSLIGERLIALAQSGDLFIHTWTTLTEATLGLALAFVVGLPIGMAMAHYKYANEVAKPLVMALYSLPRVALAPLFIIWFGIGEQPKILLIALATLFPVYLNLFSGIRGVDARLIEVVR